MDLPPPPTTSPALTAVVVLGAVKTRVARPRPSQQRLRCNATAQTQAGKAVVASSGPRSNQRSWTSTFKRFRAAHASGTKFDAQRPTTTVEAAFIKSDEVAPMAYVSIAGFCSTTGLSQNYVRELLSHSMISHLPAFGGTEPLINLHRALLDLSAAERGPRSLISPPISLDTGQ